MIAVEAQGLANTDIILITKMRMDYLILQMTPGLPAPRMKKLIILAIIAVGIIFQVGV